MSAEITPERVAALRGMVHGNIGDYPALTDCDVLELLDALESSRAEVEALRHEVELTNDHEHQILTERNDARAEAEQARIELEDERERVNVQREDIRTLRAEVQRLQQERDAAIDERNAWRSGDQDSRIEADRLRGEVQRLTDEARRLREIEVSDEVRGLLTAHGSDGIVLVCGEFASGREFVEKCRVARRSDAGRVVVPEYGECAMLDQNGEDLNPLQKFVYCQEPEPSPNPPGIICGVDPKAQFREQLQGALDWVASRLSPSPQPATGPVVEVPDVAIPMGTALQRLGARLADLLDDEAFNNIEANYLIPAIRELETAPQPSADVVVVPRGSGIGTVDMELLRIGHAWLNNRAGRELCSDRSCIRCRLADILFQVEREIDALRSSTNHDSKETP